MKYLQKTKIFKISLVVAGILGAKKALAGPYDAMVANIDNAKINLLKGDPEKITGLVIRSLLSFLGIIFFLLIIYAGFLWMTAAGNEEKIGKAKKILISAAIGIVIVFAAWAITEWVLLFMTTEAGLY